MRVFPLVPDGKTPAITDWPNRAMSDPVKVQKMWSDVFGKPKEFNIGVATGRGLLVIDFDVKEISGGSKTSSSYVHAD